MTTFSKELIQEYQTEMQVSYGVFVSDADAQVQLLSLVRCLFPSPTLQSGDGNKVGASITPTSGQKDKYL